ncbi:MAG: GC-type dockerin domain-anchored protein [Phycisphaerales bacterium]
MAAHFSPGSDADFDASGGLDADDLGAYINAYFGTAPDHSGADFNLDGVVDPDDLGDFINAFFAGC